VSDVETTEDLGPYQAVTDPYYRIQLPSVDESLLNDDWFKLSACTDAGIDFFDASKAGKLRAKAVCHNDCPVRAECLNFALVNGEKYGIWGGLDEDERRGMYATGR
jgi:WhiB family transcriptional regulator, redox-sensing transcriptional regulator